MSVIAAKQDDYQAFCEGLRGICGVDLTQYKRPQMERRLRTFFERQGYRDLIAPLTQLRQSRPALDALLDRMTINVSQLWRNPEQWHALQHEILPDLARSGSLKAWSAGCSYGAEAYTLAAVCRRAIPRALVRIVGTDIDERMVKRAREGAFSADDARSAPQSEMDAFFAPEHGGWRAKPELRAMTRFDTGDLLRMRGRPGPYDLVLCRNTVIYFSEPVRDELHANLAEALRPGGILMIGSTERVASPRDLGLTPVRPFTYRKA
jgi:chemotaxis protein methyltransferase CheR